MRLRRVMWKQKNTRRSAGRFVSLKCWFCAFVLEESAQCTETVAVGIMWPPVHTAQMQFWSHPSWRICVVCFLVCVFQSRLMREKYIFLYEGGCVMWFIKHRCNVFISMFLLWCFYSGRLTSFVSVPTCYASCLSVSSQETVETWENA